MNISSEQHTTHWLIRLEGQVALASAGELKVLLLQWLAAGKNLELNLERVEELDVTIMQLLWTAAREAGRNGFHIAARASAAAVDAVCEAGFDRMPEFPILQRVEE
jgi:hypothetical protein